MTCLQRRDVLATVPAAMLATLSPRSLAISSDATARLLQARLARQGVGLVAMQIDGPRIDIVARGERSAGEVLREDALFEIGSITKTFTALLLADAIVRNVVSLDGAVEAALPGIRLRDSVGEPIRWVDLATQRSGLPRLPDNMAPKEIADPYADYDEARLFAFTAAFRATVPRDTRWEYSNLGFGLLGHALARVQRTTYPELLRARVLRPLGMTRTILATSDQNVAGLAAGHDAARNVVSHWHFDALMGAGALVMPAGDLGRYAQAAIGAVGSPLQEAFALCLRRHADGPNERNPMGLAWLRAPLNGRVVFNHDGGTAGFSSSLWLDPERKRAAAVLANASVEVNDLALHLLDDSIPPKDLSLTEQPQVTVPVEALALLAGVYSLNPQFKLTLSVRDGQLWAQATSQPAFPLFAKAPRAFFAKVTPLEIEVDDGVPPAGLTLRQGGQILRFERDAGP